MNKTNPFIGQMDRRISIHEQVSAKNSTGESVTSLQLITHVFAQLIDSDGSEDIDGKVRYLNKRSYIFRWYSGILSNSNPLILKEGDLEFEVMHIKELGRKKHLQIFVKNYE